MFTPPLLMRNGIKAQELPQSIFIWSSLFINFYQFSHQYDYLVQYVYQKLQSSLLPLSEFIPIKTLILLYQFLILAYLANYQNIKHHLWMSPLVSRQRLLDWSSPFTKVEPRLLHTLITYALCKWGHFEPRLDTLKVH